jgi:hypothetical protein
VSGFHAGKWSNLSGILYRKVVKSLGRWKHNPKHHPNPRSSTPISHPWVDEKGGSGMNTEVLKPRNPKPWNTRGRRQRHVSSRLLPKPETLNTEIPEGEDSGMYRVVCSLIGRRGKRSVNRDQEIRNCSRNRSFDLARVRWYEVLLWSGPQHTELPLKPGRGNFRVKGVHHLGFRV